MASVKGALSLHGLLKYAWSGGGAQSCYVSGTWYGLTRAFSVGNADRLIGLVGSSLQCVAFVARFTAVGASTCDQCGTYLLTTPRSIYL